MRTLLIANILLLSLCTSCSGTPSTNLSSSPTQANTTNTSLPAQEYLLKSVDEKIHIQGDDVGGPSLIEGKKVYEGHYTVEFGKHSLELGEHLFVEDTRHDRKISTIKLQDTYTFGVVYSYVSSNFSDAQMWVNGPKEDGLFMIQFINPYAPEDGEHTLLSTSSALEFDHDLLVSSSYNNSSAIWTKTYWKYNAKQHTMEVDHMTHLNTNEEDDHWYDGGLLDRTAPQKGTPQHTVYEFYKALRYGNGERAIEFVVPEKREQGAYNSNMMSGFYSSLAIPLRLESIKEINGDALEISYAYNTGTNATLCTDTAHVFLRPIEGIPLINKIVPQKGC